MRSSKFQTNESQKTKHAQIWPGLEKCCKEIVPFRLVMNQQKIHDVHHHTSANA